MLEQMSMPVGQPFAHKVEACESDDDVELCLLAHDGSTNLLWSSAAKSQ